LRIDKFDHWNLGTYNSAIQAGIAPAIRFHNEIGVRTIHARLQELTRYWVSLARDIPGFRLHTPLDTDDLGAVSLFSIDRLDSRILEQELREKHQVHVKYRKVEHVEGLRVSPHVYMLKSDLDTFVAALKAAIEHVDR
jgi:selenocysteine lyase/cysteine desulfurase